MAADVAVPTVKGSKRTGTVTGRLLCDISICLLINGRVGESTFVCYMSAGQEHTGGGLCEAGHCYTIPQGGYQSHGSQDTHT